MTYETSKTGSFIIRRIDNELDPRWSDVGSSFNLVNAPAQKAFKKDDTKNPSSEDIKEKIINIQLKQQKAIEDNQKEVGEIKLKQDTSIKKLQEKVSQLQLEEQRKKEVESKLKINQEKNDGVRAEQVDAIKKDEEAKNQIESLKQKVSEQNSEIEKQKALVSFFKQQVLDKNKKLAASQEIVQQKSQALQEAEKINKQLQENKPLGPLDFQKAINEFQAQIEALQVDVDVLKQNKTQLENDNKKMQEQMKDFQKAANESNEIAKIAVDATRKALAEKKIAEEQLKKLKLEIEQSEPKGIKIIQEENLALKAELQNLLVENQMHQKTIEGKDERIKELERKNEIVQGHKSLLLQHLKIVTEKANSKDQPLLDAWKKNKELTAENLELKKQIRALTKK